MGGGGITSQTGPPETSAPASTGDLVEPDLRQVEVDGRRLLVAWVDSPEERQQGLRDVADLGEVDGMMFEFESERRVTFTMRDTRLPLDIYFFDSGGAGLGNLEMLPCRAEPCPSYSIDDPVRYALEVPAGSLDLGPIPDLVPP